MLLANWSRDIDRIETMDASSLKGTSTLLTLSDEHLIDVQEYVASLDNHTLHGQVFSQVFRLAHLYWKEKLRERLRREIVSLIRKPVREISRSFEVSKNFNCSRIFIGNQSSRPLPHCASVAKDPRAAVSRSADSSVPRDRVGCGRARRAKWWCILEPEEAIDHYNPSRIEK